VSPPATGHHLQQHLKLNLPEFSIRNYHCERYKYWWQITIEDVKNQEVKIAEIFLDFIHNPDST